ncbi:galactosyltransferase-related protein [uncultured Shewanella sp.]|uniref:galactosyltransferase-related protein n=1 Tax=uncultured Shewanella sp. TaxID=173975 RepID=UPI00260960EC|nr:galactosyltransferase-related protein [uncultured Shewanella sp.]
MNISFIIPYSQRSFEKNNSRLLTVINAIIDIPKTDIIIFDTSEKSANNLPHSNKIIYIHAPFKGKVYSPAFARNQAVKLSKSDYLFFIDVDLIVPNTLLNNLVSIAESLMTIGIFAFEMYPCFYLTKEASLNTKNNIDKQKQIECLDSFMKGNNDIVESIALVTSCLLINRQWFKQLKGFDETFIGHGGEDLELICRLTLHYQKGNIPIDFIYDKKTIHPANYEGFRRYLTQYSLEHLFELNFFIHRWHPRPLTHKYHRQRKVNEALLQKKLQTLLTEKCITVGSEQPVSLNKGYRNWIRSLQRDYNWPLNTYPGLFQWKRDVVIKRYFWRKCRKLYVKPRLFFTDLIKKQLDKFSQKINPS